MSDDDVTYRLTAKGWLSAHIAEAMTFAEVCELWDGLAAFCLRQAITNGYADATPALIFHEGGICVTAAKTPKKGTMSDDESTIG